MNEMIERAGTDTGGIANRRARTAIAAVLLLLVAACSSDDSEAVDASDDAGATTTVVDTPADGDGEVDAGAPELTDPGSEPASTDTTVPAGEGGAETTAPPPTAGAATKPTTTVPAAGLGAAQDPGPTVAPRPGKYRYKAEGEGGVPGSPQQSGNGEGVTTIEDVSRSGGVIKQTIQLEGQGFDSVSDIEWHSDKVLVTHSTFTFGGNTGDCDWSPDYVQSVLPLAKGTTWNSESSCTVTGFGVPIIVNRSTSNQVAGLVRIQVAGQVVDVWQIESQDEITFASSKIDSETTSYFSPKHGLIVSSNGTSEGSDGTNSGSGSFSLEILNLDPE